MEQMETQEPVKSKVDPPKQVCVSTDRYETYGEAREALKQREGLKASKQVFVPSKLKVVRRGPKRSNEGQYFELKAFKLIKPKEPEPEKTSE